MFGELIGIPYYNVLDKKTEINKYTEKKIKHKLNINHDLDDLVEIILS